MSWNDDELAEALKRYEALCRQNGMTDNAVHSYWDYARRFIEWRKGDYHRHFPGIVASESYQAGPPSAPGSCYYVIGPPPPEAALFKLGA